MTLGRGAIIIIKRQSVFRSLKWRRWLGVSRLGNLFGPDPMSGSVAKRLSQQQQRWEGDDDYVAARWMGMSERPPHRVRNCWSSRSEWIRNRENHPQGSKLGWPQQQQKSPSFPKSVVNLVQFVVVRNLIWKYSKCAWDLCFQQKSFSSEADFSTLFFRSRRVFAVE